MSVFELPAPRVRAHTRKHGEATWVDHGPHLLVDFCEFVLAPQHDKAQLRWRYGHGIPLGSDSLEDIDPLSIKGHLIKITVEFNGGEKDTVQPRVWYGRVVDVIDDKLARWQTFVCLGLSYDLEKTPVLTSMLYDPATDQKTQIARTIGFNCGPGAEKDQGDGPVGANAAPPDNLNSVLFHKNMGAQSGAPAAKQWGLNDIVRYVVDWLTPTKTDGSPSGVVWDWDPDDFLHGLNSIKVDMPIADGTSVKAIIDQVLNRRRGLSWRIEMNLSDEPAGIDYAIIRPVSLTSDSIDLPNGGELPAGAAGYGLKLNDRFLESLQLRDCGSTSYDQVIVRGARRGVVLSLSGKNNTLTRDWTSAQEYAYHIAGSADTDYATLADDIMRMRRNEQVRHRREFQRVYSWLRIPHNWAGKVGDVTSSSTPSKVAMPKVGPDDPSPSGSSAENINYWVDGLRFEHRLPLMTDVDYSGSAISSGATPTGMPDGAEQKYLQPMIFLKTPGGKWVPGETAADMFNTGWSVTDGRPLSFSASIAMNDNTPGVIVHVQGGRDRSGPIKIAKNHFTAADSLDANGILAEIDYATDLAVTVYMLLDEHVEYRYPADDELTDVDFPRRIVLHLRDAHLDFVPETTVVGVDGTGQLKTVTAGAFVRDDRKKLEAVGQIARQWYLRPRKAVSATWKRIYEFSRLGEIIPAILHDDGTQDDLETPITCIRYDFAAVKTVVQTDHIEIDFRGFYS